MMSACMCTNSGTRMWAMLARDPVSKLSTQITRWPRCSSSSHRCDPRNPAPPVTRQVAMSRAAYRPLPGPRGLERLLADVELDEVVALGLAAALLGLDELHLPHGAASVAAGVRGT